MYFCLPLKVEKNKISLTYLCHVKVLNKCQNSTRLILGRHKQVKYNTGLMRIQLIDVKSPYTSS